MKQPSTRQSDFGKDAEQAREPQTLSPARLAGGLGLRDISSRKWQQERERRLHRICSFIKVRLAKGQSLNKACKVFSRRWCGKSFKSDPTRHYAFKVSSVYRHYRAWLGAGEVPAAFRLRYFPTNRRIPAPALVRFIESCANREWLSFRAAWEAFCRLGGNHGPGRVKGRRLKLGYDSLRRNLPKGCFAKFKRCWKAIRQARQEIAELRLRLISEIRERVPDPLPRHRVNRQLDWQI